MLVLLTCTLALAQWRTVLALQLLRLLLSWKTTPASLHIEPALVLMLVVLACTLALAKCREESVHTVDGYIS